MNPDLRDRRSAQLAKNLAALPDLCVVAHPQNDDPVIIKRGEDGFYPITYSDLSPDQAANFNASVGVTREQERAMLTGSMFGWDTPGADPAYYEYEVFYDDLRAEFKAQPQIADQLIAAFRDYKRGGISLAEAKQRASKLMIAARGGEGLV